MSTEPAPAAPVSVAAPETGLRSPAGLRHLLRRGLPWAFAIGLLVLLFTRVPRDKVVAALVEGPSALLGLYAAGMVVVVLLADAAATRTAFAVTGVRAPFRGVFLARGATYLLSLINAAVGQGGMGYYLHRNGVGPLRSLGTVLFLFLTQASALALIAAVGIGALGVAGGLSTALPLLALLGLGLAVYLAIVASRPTWLTRREVLAPCFDAGVGGFAKALGARLPHVLVLVVKLWIGLRIWGIELPLAQGLVRLAAVLVAAVLPLAPAGLGTTEVALVALVSPYSHAPTAGARESVVLAFALLYHLFGMAGQALVGLGCLGVLSRRRRLGEEPAGA